MNVLSYASNGEKFILATLAALPKSTGQGESVLEGAMYLGTRTPEGWSLDSLNAPLTQFVGQIPIAMEAESGDTLWEQHTPQQSAFNLGLYLRTPEGSQGRYSFIGPLHLPLTQEEESNSIATDERHFDRPIGATTDYRHIVVFATEAQDYWPFDHTEGEGGSIYEYSGVGNTQPVLIGVKDGKEGTTLISTCGTHFGGKGSTYNALSADGETIFFTVLSGCGTPAFDEVYARQHGALISNAEAKTIHVSANHCTKECGEESGKNFEGASADGQRVFFTSTQRLTDDAVDGTASGNAAARGEKGCSKTEANLGGCNLYEFELNSAEEGEEGTLKVVAAGEVLGVAGIAEDGTRAYFVSRKVITESGANEYGASPLAEQPNLYVYNALTGVTKFIATLSGNDEAVWAKTFATRPVEVAGLSGEFLLLASATSGIIPSDQTNYVQLYEFDALTGELERVTKGEEGYNDNGLATGISAERIAEQASVLGGGRGGFRTTTNRLNISTDGKTVVFVTAGRLSSRALSAQASCLSVYEFHTNGGLAQGSVRLISDGQDVELYKGVTCGAFLQGLDASGANILFSTADPLTATDVDGVQRDIYDARIDGGFVPPVRPEQSGCRSEACESAPSAAALMPPIPSSMTERGEAAAEQQAGGTSKSRKQDKKARKRNGSLRQALRRCRKKAKPARTVCEHRVRNQKNSARNSARRIGRNG